MLAHLALIRASLYLRRCPNVATASGAGVHASSAVCISKLLIAKADGCGTDVRSVLPDGTTSFHYSKQEHLVPSYPTVYNRHFTNNIKMQARVCRNLNS
jgi:hypothetical protein